MHCPQCGFRDYYEFQEVEVKLEVPGEGEVEDCLELVVCSSCGNVFISNWKDFFVENFQGRKVGD